MFISRSWHIHEDMTVLNTKTSIEAFAVFFFFIMCWFPKLLLALAQECFQAL